MTTGLRTCRTRVRRGSLPWLACAAALGAAAWAGPASAEAPAASEAPAVATAFDTGWAQDLAEELMSPFCPGRPLADCTSPDAARLRLWIGVQAAAGRTREDVEEELLARYGETIRGRPEAEGFGAAAYWIPVAVFAGGGALAAWFLRRATRRGAASAAPPAPLDPELDRRLDEVLSR